MQSYFCLKLCCFCVVLFFNFIDLLKSLSKLIVTVPNNNKKRPKSKMLQTEPGVQCKVPEHGLSRSKTFASASLKMHVPYLPNIFLHPLHVNNRLKALFTQGKERWLDNTLIQDVVPYSIKCFVLHATSKL